MMYNKGFTLIEVLAAMAIISILSSFVIVSFGNAKTERRVEGEARRFSSVLRKMQNDSLTGKNPGAGVPCAFYTGSSSVGNASISMSYIMRSSGSCSNGTTVQVLPSHDLGFGVTLTVANTGVRFVVPHGEVWTGNGSSKLTNPVQYTLGKDGYVWSVCVFPGGRIHERVGAGC